VERSKRVRLLLVLVALVATLGAAQAASAAPLAPVELTPPSIVGSALEGQPVSCSPGTWLGNPTGYSYTWQRNAAEIAGATGSSYTLTAADVANAITCTVVASNGASSLPAISAPVIPVGLPSAGAPVETSLPAISGKAEQGQMLSCSHGSWTNSPTGYAYSWERNAAAIAAASGSSYTLTTSDVTKAITCTVVAHNASGNGVPAVSAPVVPIGLPAPPVVVAPPVISGTAEQGQLISCSTGTWLGDPTSYAYSWQRAGTAIAGAVSSTYKLASTDVGKAITCAVIAHNASGNSLPSLSLPVLPVPIPTGLVPVSTAPPVISGSPEQGHTVSCSNGSWLNGPDSYAYSWQRNASDIAGATGSTYTLTAADVNRAITCTVVAHNAAGNSVPAISLPIVPVSLPAGLVPIDVVPPLISGSAQEGQTVTCSAGIWLNSPTRYSYSWQRDATTIAGQTGSSYTITGDDVNHAITCTVVAGNTAGNSVPAISLPVLPIALPLPGIPLPVNTALPVISGIPFQGQTLSCLTGSWTNNPTGFVYSWQRTGAAIPGASGATYAVGAADAGQAITCAVQAVNAAGLSVAAVSLPVLIPAPPSPGPAPGPVAPRLHAPTVIAFWINPGKLTITVKGKRRTSLGTKFHYILDQNAGVLIEIQKKLSGRVKDKRCVAVTKRNRKARPCPRWVTVRVRAVKHGRAGKNTFRWLGIVNGNRLLTAGAYRVYLAAENPAGWSAVHNKPLRAVRKLVKPPKRKAKR
jgi:hypothetical protein